MIMDREGGNHVLRCASFFHQHVVDQYATIESERLRYIQLNQRRLRAEKYVYLRDAVNADGCPNTQHLGSWLFCLSHSQEAQGI
jgi:hypothetical protein